MMGRKERHFAPLIKVSLEGLVPLDHFYQHLERTLDLSFVREFMHETYAGKGRCHVSGVPVGERGMKLFYSCFRTFFLLLLSLSLWGCGALSDTPQQTPDQAVQTFCQAVMSGDYSTAYSMVDLSEQVQMDSQTFDTLIDGASDCVWSEPQISQDGMTADTYITFTWSTVLPGRARAGRWSGSPARCVCQLRWLVRMVIGLDGVWRLGVIT